MKINIMAHLKKGLKSETLAPIVVNYLKQALHGLQREYDSDEIAILVKASEGQLETVLYYTKDGQTALETVPYMKAVFGVSTAEFALIKALFPVGKVIEGIAQYVESATAQNGGRVFLSLQDDRPVLMVHKGGATQVYDLSEELPKIIGAAGEGSLEAFATSVVEDVGAGEGEPGENEG